MSRNPPTYLGSSRSTNEESVFRMLLDDTMKCTLNNKNNWRKGTGFPDWRPLSVSLEGSYQGKVSVKIQHPTWFQLHSLTLCFVSA